MPTFEFTSPDGKSYSVEGPDGATRRRRFKSCKPRSVQSLPPVRGSVKTSLALPRPHPAASLQVLRASPEICCTRA
jgi:hypothetical protein